MRKLLRFTQSEFANKIGVESYLIVLRYEKNIHKPDLSKIRLVSLRGDVSENWILKGTVNSKNCDRLVAAYKVIYRKQEADLHREYSEDKFNRSLSVFARNLRVSPEFIECIKSHSIDPHPNIFKKFCAAYSVDYSVFKDILSNKTDSGFNDDIYYGSGGVSHKNSNMLDEINFLLQEDEAAQKMVLEILRSRKTINDNTEKLKHKKS